MIRIDLKKDDLGKGSKRSVADQLKQLQIPISPKIIEFTSDVRNLTVVGVVVALSLLPYLFLSQYQGFVEAQHRRSLATLAEEAAKLSVEIDKLKPFQRELESYEQQKRLVTERLSVVNRLLTSRSAAVPVIDTLGQGLPARAWLSELEYSLKDKPGVVEAQGRAYSHEDISDYMEKLGESRYLAEVVLEEVASTLEGQTEVKTFKIKVRPKNDGSLDLPKDAPKGEVPRAVAETPAK